MRKSLLFTGIAAAAAAGVLWLVLSEPAAVDSWSEGDSTVSTGETPGAARLHGSWKKTPSPAAAAVPLHLRGRVVDRSGAPLSGVPVGARRVRALKPDAGADAATRETDESRFQKSVSGIDAPSSGPHKYESNGVTAGDGTFDLTVKETGNYDLEALPPPPKIGTGEWVDVDGSEPSESAHLHVIDGSRLEGRFIDGAGRGVVAVLGGSWELQGIEVGYAMDPVRSAADGTFVVDAVPNGKADLDVTVPGRGTLDGIALTTPHEGLWTLRIAGFGGVVKGHVRDATGHPVEGADLSIHVSGTATGSGSGDGSSGTATGATLRGRTGADGGYRIEGAFTGRVTEVEALARGYVLHRSKTPLAKWNGALVAAGTETTIDVALSRGATATGHVVMDGSQERVAKARVLLQRLDSTTWPRPKPIDVETGGDGAFRAEGLALGKWVAAASAPGLYDLGIEGGRSARDDSSNERSPPPENTFVLMREGETVDRTLTLARGAAVRGRVLSPDGKGVGDASIRASDADAGRWLYEWGGEWSNEEAELARSEADGTFVVPGLAPRPEWYLIAVKAPYVGKYSEKFAVAAGVATPDVVLRLELGASVSGRIVSDDGKPVVGAHVYFDERREPRSGRRTSTSSGPDGAFLLEGVPAGEVDVEAWANEFAWASKTVAPALSPGESRAGVDLKLVREAKIRGVIVDGKGEGVPGHSVQVEAPISGDSRQSWSNSSGSDGSFSLEVPAGVHAVVKVEVDVGRTDERTVVSPAEGLRFVVKPKPTCVLEGRVVDSAGSPIPLCHVQCEGADTSGGGKEAVGGEFRLQATGLPPFVLRVNGARDASGRALNLLPGEATVADASSGPVTIVLEKGLEIRGRVIADDGKGVPRAGIRLEQDVSMDVARQSPLVARTADDGSFAIPALTEGAYVLQVEPASPHLAPPAVHTTAGTLDLTIRLKTGTAISGHVLGPDGRPRGQVAVQAEWKTATDSGTARCDSSADGAFRLEPMPAEALATVTSWQEVENLAPDQLLLPATVADVRAGSSDVTVRMGRGVAIRGVVTSPGGALPPGLVVRCRRASDPPGEYASETEIEEGGNADFQLSPLEPGEWIVTVKSPTAGEVARAASVRAPTDGLRLSVPDPLEVTGRLVGGEDLKGFTIRAWVDGRSPEDGGEFETDGDGTFTMRLPRGPTYRFIASKSGDDRYAASGAIRPGTADVTMTLVTGSTIAGVLEHSPGTPLHGDPGGWIGAQSPGWVSYVSPESDGRFLFRGLPPGTYTLVGHAESGGSEVKVEGVATGTRDVRLRLP